MALPYYTKNESDLREQEVKNTVQSISAGEGGKIYDSLADAKAVDPKPANGTIFQIKGFGYYSFQSADQEGIRFEREYIDTSFFVQNKNKINLNSLFSKRLGPDGISISNSSNPIVGLTGSTLLKPNTTYSVSGDFYNYGGGNPRGILSANPEAQSGTLVNFTDTSGGKKFTTGSDDLHFRLDVNLENGVYIGETQLEEGNVTPFVEPKKTLPEPDLSTVNTQIDQLKDDLSKVFEEIDFAKNAITGIYKEDGSISVPSQNWNYTEKISVKAGDEVKYKGKTIGDDAVAVIGFDVSGNSIVISKTIDTGSNYQAFSIPENVVEVAASSIILDVDFSFLVTVFKQQSSPEPIEIKLDYYLHPISYAIEGEEIKVNPNGVISKHPKDYSKDIIWNLKEGNSDFLQIIPETTDIDVILRSRDLSGDIINVGATKIKVTPTNVIKSPTIAQNFIHFGDSTVEGTASSGIQGAVANELSRRLTGIGTALLTGDESPVSLNLNNVFFRGTKGNQPIKHEGIGGWRASTYLNNSTDNAFWNPGTSEFDLAYYLEQNNFLESQTSGGVNSTGSNLTVLIQLGWNDAYTIGGVSEGAADLQSLVNKMKLDLSGVKIKILGLPAPPDALFKNYGDRNVSPESIMREIINPFNREYAMLTGCEFIQISHVFFPESSFPTTQIRKSLRNSEERTVYTDYVHPNKRGYAQFADAWFYNIIYNYCR